VKKPISEGSASTSSAGVCERVLTAAKIGPFIIAVAPKPVPELLALAGLTVGGAGLARCSDRSCPTRMLGDEVVERTDDLHAVFSAATFALWAAIPFVAAARATSAPPGFRRGSRAVGAATVAAIVVSGRMAQGDSPSGGTGQRVFLASALAWYPLAAAFAEGD
jgi:hypothetical protein